MIHNSWTAISKNGFNNVAKLKINKNERFILENPSVHEIEGVS